MVWGDNTYSRFVATVKVLLPLAALALLSTMFLLSRKVDPTASIPLARVDVERMVREQSISAPTYATVSANGTAISITADRVVPEAGGNNQALAEALVARFEYPDGTVTDVRSDGGRMSTTEGWAVLEGNVVLDTSDGMQMTTEALKTALNGDWLRSDVAVTVTGPLGRLEAESMEILHSKTLPGRYVANFNGGVKLLYTPSNTKDAE